MGLLYTYNKQFMVEHWLSGYNWKGTGTWSTSYEPGRWYHVAGVIDKTHGEVKIYVDGVLVYTDWFTPGSAALEYNSEPFRLGVSYPNASNWGHAANGSIDDARIYNRALTAEEIAQFRNHSLLFHLRLDETSGSTATDSSPAGNNGTVYGAPSQGVSALRKTGYHFDAQADYVEIAASTRLNQIADNNGDFSAAFWVKPDAGATHYRLPLRLTGADGDSPDIFVKPDNRVQVELESASGTQYASSSTALPEDEWSHVVVAKSGFDVEFYINGKFDSSTTLGAASKGGGLARIAYTAWGTGPDLAIDDVRLYAYKLSPAEIAELHGLIGHWKLNEPSGSIAYDSSGVGNDSFYVNGAAPGANGPYPGVGTDAAEFDGAAAYVGPDIVSTYNTIDEAVSVAAWVLFDQDVADQTQQNKIFDRTNWGAMQGYGLFTDLPFNDAILFRVMDGTTYADAIWYAPDIKAGEWHHVVGTYDGANVKLYIDGQLQHTQAFVSQVDPSSMSWPSLGYDLAGRLFDVRLYNRAVTEAEIAKMYGLVGWWRMEEVSGATAADSSGAGNHATITGTPSWQSDAKEGSGSLELDGATRVVLPKLAIDATSTGASIAGWAKLTSADVSGAEIVSLGDYLGIRLDGGWGGTRAFAYNGSSWDGAFTGMNFENAGWHHFAAVFNDATLEIEFYIDGILKSTQTASSPLALSGLVDQTAIGTHADPSQTDYDFAGQLDDIKVFNRPLAREEIRKLFYGGFVPGVRIIEWVEVRTP
ncbi:MAG: LamG domain-containing protein, partial [Planctomycetales bacterium]|nr:LamG domain-containing protein [Planctomycetales bacterium]